jgi:DNA-binding PadR family transcriptional regulator
VEALLGAKAALLLALSQGPGYGAGLIEKVRDGTLGHVRLGRGNVYTALRALESGGLVTSWRVVPGGRRGSRARVYYELTPKGVGVAREQKRAFAGLLAPAAPTPSAAEAALMGDRLRRCSEVSAFALGLRDGLQRASS